MTIRLPLLLLTGLLSGLAHPGHAARVRDREMEVLSQRLFPTLNAIGTSAASANSAETARLAAMLETRRLRRLACARAPACVVEASKWLPPEIEIAADTAARMVRPGRELKLSHDTVRNEVQRELQGLNSILAVYGLGGAPRYPPIDGPDVAVGSRVFATQVADAVALSEAENAEAGPMLDPSVELALALLDVNDRDDAAEFEPLDARYNKLAITRARKLDWPHYRYTAIIVPGEGPDDLATPLSATGKLRIRLAAMRYYDGLAPFILVTGGAVHPRGAKYAEAIEMRQALIERYGVPPDSIVVEPYARHTTTNLRNAARRLFALGAPVDRDALIVTDRQQSLYIESARFTERNQRELGYQPGRIGARLSPFELTFRPAQESVRVDPLDPLDP